MGDLKVFFGMFTQRLSKSMLQTNKSVAIGSTIVIMEQSPDSQTHIFTFKKFATTFDVCHRFRSDGIQIIKRSKLEVQNSRLDF